MSNGAGSLIQLHLHENFDVIAMLSDVDGILYYKATPVFPSVSKKDNNGITLESDGLFMSNLTMLNFQQYDIVSRFKVVNNALTFNGTIIPQEYTKTQIAGMIAELWNELEPDTSGGDTSDTTES